MTEQATSPALADLRDQLRQLIDLTNAGVLSSDQAAGPRAQLEKQILDRVLAGEEPTTTSLPSAPEANKSTPPTNRRTWLLIGAFVSTVALSTYAWVGHPQAWDQSPSPAKELQTGDGGGAVPARVNGSTQAAHPTDQAQIESMVRNLADKLKADPENAEGWAMLARSHAVLGKFDLADNAYRKARALRPQDAQLLADHADTLAVLKGRKLDGEPAKLVEQALKIDPRNFKALSLAGTIAFQGGEHAKAIDLWQRAVASAPADNPELVQQIKDGLQEARALAGSSKTPDPVRATGALTVTGIVDIDPALRKKLPADAVVFIHAKAVQGPPMPLAVLRMQLKDLPATFTLGDAQAMSNELKISGFKQVAVAARVSLSGEALPKAGDWEGRSGAVAVGDQDIKVVIQTPVK